MRRVLAVLEPFLVSTHLRRFPAAITGYTRYLIPVIIEGPHHDHGVVVRAAAQGSRTRVVDPHWCCIFWRGHTMEHRPVQKLVRELVVQSIAEWIRIMLHLRPESALYFGALTLELTYIEGPQQALVLAGFGIEEWYRGVDIICSLVAAGLDHEYLVSCET
jgi:hypothetical protein